ncbi:hypothetical protein GCM10010873_05020 [Cypionkella aquatica]|uniref:DUF2946 domain-containing protein n=1 Tax=Cypionkella aquatica TaxID=1756042 RepID=A0AA37TPD8_9RHOB|nr:hypothetical protein [Cypionkella aquatica]GLS85529.1 hypothetical protein GCM10010873_05020 [Cypionkella aquatica]
MHRFARQFALNVMALLLAVALTTLGFGHRMVLQDPVDLSAYAMPDGTLPELCHDSGMGDHSSKDQAPCPLCRIIAAFEIPASTGVPAVHLVAVAQVWPQLAVADASAYPPATPPARGPPVTQI